MSPILAAGARILAECMRAMRASQYDRSRNVAQWKCERNRLLYH
ncbi:hypothetical protein [Paraburkholderia phosphatilytica]|nr:hypothetical protein [Paraburkholderia phosphatilytica]